MCTLCDGRESSEGQEMTMGSIVHDHKHGNNEADW